MGLIGAFISFATRKVPPEFNEMKLLTISIYNLLFFGVVIIPVFLVLQPLNPFAAWVLRTCAVLYAFTATLVLQFTPMIVGTFIQDKGKNMKRFRSQISPKSKLSGTSGSDFTHY